MTLSKSGYFGFAGGGKDGAVVDMWLASRFTSPPQENQAPPGSTPDAGPVTTSTAFGGPGAYIITNLVSEDYYIRVQYGDNTYWGSASAGSIAGAGSSTAVPWSIDPASNNGVTRIRSSTGNFLNNAGFGIWFNGTNVAPNGWTMDGGTSSVQQSSTTTQGPYSAEVSFDTSNTGEFWQGVPTSTLVNYTFTCYTQLVSGTGIGRLVAQQNSAPYTEFASINLSTVAGWQLACLTFQPSAGTSTRFSIKSGNTVTSTWLVDECMFQESENVATTFQYAFIDDTNTQNVYGNKIFGFLQASTLESTGVVSPGNGTTVGSNMWSGTGVPSSGLGSNGDFYFRTDGGSGTHLYFKASGAWNGIV